MQLISSIECRDPSDVLAFAVFITLLRPVGAIDRGALNLVHHHTAQFRHQNARVAVVFTVIVRVPNNPIHHDTVLETAQLVVVDHLQRWLKLELSTGVVDMRILAFEVVCHFLEPRVEGDGIEVGEAETQRSAVRQEFWTLEQSLERGLQVRDGVGIWSDGGSSRSGRRVNQVQVIGEGNPTSTGDLQDLMLYVTVERDVCEGRRGSGSGQGAGVELPLVIPVAEDELPSLVGGGVEDHERPEHVCAPGSVLVRLEERAFV